MTDLRRLFGVWTCVCALSCGLAAGAFALPADRHYEMVSPVFKGGYGVTGLSPIEAVSSDGEAVIYGSPGAFAGAPSGLSVMGYLAQRGTSGWSTVPVMPPPAVMAVPTAVDVSPSLDRTLRLGLPGSNVLNPVNEPILELHETDLPDTVEDWERVGTIVPVEPKLIELTNYASSSVDFCHIVIASNSTEPLLPEGVGASSELYQYDRGCAGEPRSLSMVSVDNRGNPIEPKCQANIGAEDYLQSGFGKSAFNAVSADGEEVFFTVCVKTPSPTERERFGAGLPHQVFARLGGAKTIEVSRPVGPCVGKGTPGEVPCEEGGVERASADFQGASEDGSRVYFTAPLAPGQTPLVPNDTDVSSNLYLASIGCSSAKPACTAAEREVVSLSEVSQDPSSGQAADVRGVVRVAPDGSRVYFVAGGDLLGAAQQQALEGEGRAVPRLGADNLYVYDSNAGTVEFIGDLCSGEELSGTIEEVHCPSPTGSDEPLWTNSEGEIPRTAGHTVASEVQTAGSDGRFLVFATYAQLLGSDSNVAKDVYRFDALTGGLTRVSSGEGGYDANGNETVLNKEGEALGAGIHPGFHGGKLVRDHELGTYAISQDGSRIVFTSAAPLSPLASNGLNNAYEWREGASGGEGSISLISSGDSVEPVNDVVISPNGLSVFFVTSEGLAPQDADGAPDIYNARLEGGFPQPQAEPRSCEGDACQGPLTNPAPLLISGSVSQTPGGNFAAPVKPKAGKKKARRCKRGHVKRNGKCVKRLKKAKGGR